MSSTLLGFNIKNGSLKVLSWEGLTFQQVVSSIQKNGNNLTQPRNFFHPLPLKIYRRNIGYTTNGLISSNNEKQSLTISTVIEQPGGAVKTVTPICSNNGVTIISDAKIPNNTLETGACQYSSCTTVAVNSLKKIRSSGMIRQKNYNINNYQYLQNRDKTFSQNQYNYIKSGNSNVKPGSALALLNNNNYVQNASGQFNVSNNTVIYKPNNSKYAQQGGVSSSSRIERIKLENIEKTAYMYKQTYGTTSNDYKTSVTYSGSYGPNNGVTFGKKDLYNTPTPQITKVYFSTNQSTIHSPL